MEFRSRQLAILVVGLVFCSALVAFSGLGGTVVAALSQPSEDAQRPGAAAPMHAEIHAGDSHDSAPRELMLTAAAEEMTAETVRDLIEDLRDDSVRFNALRAMRTLACVGPRAVSALAPALESTDEQQRHLAAALLRPHQKGKPSPQLIRVTVEGLARRFNRIYELRRARQCFAFLLEHPQRARRELETALYQGDAQQKFLSAFLLAKSGSKAHFWTIADLLLPHLRDNDISGDGLMAAHGLYHLGPGVLPVLDRTRPTADAQARRLLKQITMDIESPPRTRAEQRSRALRSGMKEVTRLYHDPVLEFDPLRSRLPTW